MSTPIERALQREIIVDCMKNHPCRLLVGQIEELLANQGVTLPAWKIRRRLLELRRSGRVFRYMKWSAHVYELRRQERMAR